MRIFLPLSILAVVFLPAALHAEVTLATPFRDGAVLQGGKPVPVWGTANAGEKVSVVFNDQTKQTQADAQGRWSVKLDSLAASDKPAELCVAGQNVVTVKNIVVGEVWLCAGQSNMHFMVKQALNAKREMDVARHPLIRQFMVNSCVSDKPLGLVEGDWQECSPKTVGEFTAVGYFFARDLHRELAVPIGIIHATLGGSPIEGWLSEQALASNPAFAVVAQRWALLKPRVSGEGLRNQPAGLYNGLVRPLEPFAMAGFLWYQGEGNCERADEYALLFRTMIQHWRTDFQQPGLPFLFVQLPNFIDTRDKTGDSWPRLREGQASALAQPNTAMVVTIDVGDAIQLHPLNKQAVGKRLALQALAKVYDRKVEATGPVFAGLSREASALRLRFDHAAGLAFVGDAGKAFELAGANGKLVPAQARIQGETVIVSAPGVDQPAAIRFEWSNNPEAFLVNQSKLPAAPFRLGVSGIDVNNAGLPASVTY